LQKSSQPLSNPDVIKNKKTSKRIKSKKVDNEEEMKSRIHKFPKKENQDRKQPENKDTHQPSNNQNLMKY